MEIICRGNENGHYCNPTFLTWRYSRIGGSGVPPGGQKFSGLVAGSER
jgi:hypothetical protein